ncbi:MAG: diacylglycerol kinase family protein [Syntrophomonadaceae bacterium]|nr:diacylglycerol kinase family protein [Syntrophomonadaceae bacterium]
MKRLAVSFSCALQGIYQSIAGAPNMRIHLLAAVSVVVLGYIVSLTRIEWALLSLTVFMVLTAETINSAIERTVDLACQERHAIAKLAKDLAAGAVLLTALNAIVMAILLFGPYLQRVII